MLLLGKRKNLSPDHKKAAAARTRRPAALPRWQQSAECQDDPIAASNGFPFDDDAAGDFFRSRKRRQWGRSEIGAKNLATTNELWSRIGADDTTNKVEREASNRILVVSSMLTDYYSLLLTLWLLMRLLSSNYSTLRRCVVKKVKAHTLFASLLGNQDRRRVGQ